MLQEARTLMGLVGSRSDLPVRPDNGTCPTGLQASKSTYRKIASRLHQPNACCAVYT